MNPLCVSVKDSTFLQDKASIIKQYSIEKFFLQEKIKVSFQLYDMMALALQDEEHSALAKLMDIGETFLASSGSCEWAFSLMNQVKNKLKKSILEVHR